MDVEYRQDPDILLYKIVLKVPSASVKSDNYELFHKSDSSKGLVSIIDVLDNIWFLILLLYDELSWEKSFEHSKLTQRHGSRSSGTMY